MRLRCGGGGGGGLECATEDGWQTEEMRKFQLSVVFPSAIQAARG